MDQNNRISGEAKISKLLLKFSVPCVMGLLISALYNIVDQIFIGNSELGYLGNAATEVSFPVICIANAFAWCVGDGAASYLSICAGLFVGAAWATAIGQVASFAMCAVYFLKLRNFVLSKRSFIPDKEILKNTISLGAATFVTQISIVVMSLVCNITLFHYGELSKYGPDIPISVFSIQTKVYTVVCNIVTGIVLESESSEAETRCIRSLR